MSKQPLTVRDLISELRDQDGDALVCTSSTFGFMSISILRVLDDQDVLDSVETPEYLVPRILVLE